MKRKFQKSLLALLSVSIFLFSACKKDEAPKEDYAAIKKGWVTGTWKQKDITLGVSTSVKVGSTKIPLNAGSSMLDDPTINYLLEQMAGANPFGFTRNNVYTFAADGTYAVEGANDYSIAFSLPVAGKSGKWDTEVYSSVLALFPSTDTRDPHWINNITATTLNLAISINLPGLGDVPMNLLLEKQ
ncbi:MAG: hypothetical protein J0I84_13475 [Terrimonas sp.]|nr:hypothetical protein [Terrimonas sp.]OJY90021.1 MAG: hypothetical protein BGP13_23280 [Sphingobacteriales bacterium 40-81]